MPRWVVNLAITSANIKNFILLVKPLLREATEIKRVAKWKNWAASGRGIDRTFTTPIVGPLITAPAT